MVAKLSEEERAAQRRIIGTVRACGRLGGGGLGMWRERDCGEWKATAAEIADDLSLLEIPHQMVTAFRPPLANSPTQKPRQGEEVRVATADLRHLVRRMPSFQKWIDQVPDDAPGFEFVYCQPRADGMTFVAVSAYAADWPAWTVKQAGPMGLLCAECGHDLRSRGDGSRLPFNIPAPKQPKRRRLVCGVCCNHGLDELNRLAGLGGQTSSVDTMAKKD
ncbi:hypothetical protein PV410_17015 [Streptomyces sp. PA03-5A]|nr:hypothetical protein [Streptomyces sp. PA03-5A]